MSRDLRRAVLLFALLAGWLRAEDQVPAETEPRPVGFSRERMLSFIDPDHVRSATSAATPAAGEVPAAVLAEAAAAGKPAPAPLVASPAALDAADQIDAQLLAADTLLARGNTVSAGDRFIAATKLVAGLGRDDRRALGERFREQRRHLGLVADHLLADPEVRAALGTDPLVPTAAEHAAAVAPADATAQPAP